jgi:glyoxylase-like metal-dependent hydrolase (beta-lactamase superfamily II)
MMIKTEEIIGGIYLIGGPNITSSNDAAIYLIDFASDLIMIDAGAGRSALQIVRNIEMLGLNPANISHLILTHCHIDHIGAAPFFNERYGTKILIHELDAKAVETGDSLKTAANWYGTTFPPTKVDRKLKGLHEILKFGAEEFHCLHTPGHTPGSIAVYLDRCGKRVLFMAHLTLLLVPTLKPGKNQCRYYSPLMPIFSAKAILASIRQKIACAIISSVIWKNTND